MLYIFCFFFQAEDGIRDTSVTGVQTCALPISDARTARPTILSAGCGISAARSGKRAGTSGRESDCRKRLTMRSSSEWRSEERRVGKECGWRGRPCDCKQKKEEKLR